VNSLRRAVSAALIALVMGGLAISPAQAAPKPAADTWVGQVQRDGSPQGSGGVPRSHYDYVGRACPESAEICYDIVANYRIVALNPSAARAVRRLAGGRARLHGHLGPGSGQRHTGTLYVWKAERPAP
jgi:hypothetical protein